MLEGEGIGSGNSFVETKLAAKLIESFFLCCQTYGILLQNEISEKYIVEMERWLNMSMEGKQRCA